MPLGTGFWYDRRNRRYHRISEHATDAVQHSRRFRSQAVAHLDPTRDREAIVRHVAAQEFIRIRWWRDRLGWEFAGDPDAALVTLRRFISRRGVGPVTLVTISDFKANISICVSASSVMASQSATDLGLIAPTSRRTP